ncbi:M48 family metalloprotease [Novosphingobium sp. ERN07]|uniref:M48 family metalloprotease n=1 Tax=Novosphingobium sp. ERN07 TaxID=2726187 RepID=UPI0014563496|nr:M48 family metallopeptidase [Novosphingobium sp. ERN07]NLR69401.1 M48 family metalloprotease [Novosphingobium sp. ERN07]
MIADKIASSARPRSKVWMRCCMAMFGTMALFAAHPSDAADSVDTDAAWPVRLRFDMARVAQVEWRLRQVSGDLCPTMASDIGAVLDDRRAYRKADWPLLARTLGMGEWPVVAALIPDGPAAQAGLMVGDEIEAVNGQTVDSIIERHKAGPLVAEAVLGDIAATPQGQAIDLVVRRGAQSRTVSVMPARHCAVRLVLEADRSIDAHSDARNVSISTGLVTLSANDDELAMVAGHEMAHIIHRDRRGGGIGKRRRMEDAADSLGLQLLHCAGYHASAGVMLFDRLRKRDWLGFLRAPTHRSFAKRVERLQGEIPGLTCPATPHPAV